MFLFGLCIGGEAKYHARYPLLSLLVFTDRATQLITIHDGHVAIGYHQVETLLAPRLKAGGTLLGGGKLVPQVAQLLTHQQAVRRVVVYHQHVEHWSGSGWQ